MHEDKEVDEAAKSYYPTTVKFILPFICLWLCLTFYCVDTTLEGIFKLMTMAPLAMCVTWTATEYYFHRFDLHKELHLDPKAPADSAHLMHIFARHIHHHVFMNQRYRIVLPTKTFK
jgi:hypothetical protein